MSASTNDNFHTSPFSAISQLLCSAKTQLRDLVLGGRYVPKKVTCSSSSLMWIARNSSVPSKDEFDILDDDVMDLLYLLRATRNALAPINMMPSEVLAIVPDFWDEEDRDKDVIRLTHVCRTWRETFISRSALWTRVTCMDEDQTLVYLKRSNRSPICLTLGVGCDPYLEDLFFEIIPDTIGRLESLNLQVPRHDLKDVASRLSSPAPLLKHLSLCADVRFGSEWHPSLPPEFFGGDLSSLRRLCLYCVNTKLPWRNMANLTWLELGHMSSGVISVAELLDFLESAPRLQQARLDEIPLIPDTQHRRLVQLSCLKKFHFEGYQSSSPLFNHLLIPPGADLEIRLRSPHPRVEDFLPRPLDNLENLQNFTGACISYSAFGTSTEFTGPNGRVALHLERYGRDYPNTSFEPLVFFDTSKTTHLELIRNHLPSEGVPYKVLLPMANLRTLIISRCIDLPSLFIALDPNRNWQNTLICPKLEKLVIRVAEADEFDDKGVMSMVVARAQRGVKLKSVRIFGQVESTLIAELGDHVSRVVYDPAIDGGINEDDGDGNAEN